MPKNIVHLSDRHLAIIEQDIGSRLEKTRKMFEKRPDRRDLERKVHSYESLLLAAHGMPPPPPLKVGKKKIAPYIFRPGDAFVFRGEEEVWEFRALRLVDWKWWAFYNDGDGETRTRMVKGQLDLVKVDKTTKE